MDTNLRTALWDVFRVIFDEPNVWWGNGNFKVGQLPLISILVTSIEHSDESLSLSDPEGDTIIHTDSTINLTIEYFASGAVPYQAVDKLSAGLMKLRSGVIRYLLSTKNLSFVGISNGPIDISGIDGSGFESRASADLRFRFGTSLADKFGWIEEIAAITAETQGD